MPPLDLPGYQLYQQVLTSAAHGTPLWEPGSSLIAPSIGDVGYLRFGSFIRLLNATLPAGHPDNENGVPDNYVPLSMKETSVHRSVLLKGVIASSGVQTTGLSPSETDSSLHFKCTDKAGAVLMTDSVVQRQDVAASNLEAFADYMAAHAHSFASFARSQLMYEVAMQELILLTGCDFTRGNYSVTVFDSVSISQWIGASFRLSPPAADDHDKPYSIGNGFFHSYGPRRSELESCLFVRGFKVLDRLAEKIEREDMAESSLVWGEDEDDGQPLGPLDAVLRYLSDNSNVEIAVAHDNDLTRVLEKDSCSLAYHTLLESLSKARQPIAVRGKVAFLA